MRFRFRTVLFLLPLVFCGCLSRYESPRRAYRDLQVYADETGLTVVNRSEQTLQLSARIAENRWQATVAPGDKAVWQLAEFAESELRGAILVDGVIERELILGVGPDRNITGCFAPRPPSSQPEVRGTVPFCGFRILDTVPASAGPGTRQELSSAVRDLQRIGQHITGQPLPLLANSAGPTIWIASSDDSRLQPPGSYHLRIQTGDIRIEAASLEGARNGVYGLLTDYLGCRWYQPRGLGESLPDPNPRLRLPEVDEWKQPSWFSVPGMSWRGCGDWDRRNRSVINDGRMKFGHAWGWMINVDSHPPEVFGELYARDESGQILMYEKGWTHSNFCSTHPRVLEIVAANINATFDEDPSRIAASLDPNDYAPMCRCPRCLALDKSLGVEVTDGSRASDRLLHFSREIHSRLKPKHQDKFLGILIYGHQMELPVSASPHVKHAGVICNFPPRYDHSRPWTDPSSEFNQDFLRLVRGWGERLTQLGYYDYYGHYYYFGPFPMVHKMREDLPAFHEMGGTFLDIEAQPNFGIQGLNHYVAARLAWDVEADVDALLADFMRGYYREASEPMRRFWMTAERHFALTPPGVRTELRAAERPEFWDELDDFLSAAERAAKTPILRDRLAFHRAGFNYGRSRFRLQQKYGRGLQRATTDAARAECRAYADWVRELRKRFPDGGDAYWPPLVRDVFYLDVEAMLRSQ